MRGKLVKQDPNDEPASVLLRKIKAEKQELIKEKKIKKTKPLPPITDDEKPFEIPNNWEWVRLGDILTVHSGKNLPKKNLVKNGKYIVYGANGIIGNFNKSNTSENTLLIGRVGFYAGVIHITSKEAWVTDNSLVVSESTRLSKKWLYYALSFLNLSKLSSQTAQPVISGNKIYRTLLALPPLVEQNKIVIEIDNLLSIISC